MKVVRIFEQDGERWTKTDPLDELAGWIAVVEVDEWHGALRATVRGREVRLYRRWKSLDWSSQPLTVELVFPGEELPVLEEGDLLEVPPSAPMTPEARRFNEVLKRVYRAPTSQAYREAFPTACASLAALGDGSRPMIAERVGR